MSADELYKKYSDNGYRFTDEIISRYALSLATKPFVILSGISGTGKTKIAQLFEPLLKDNQAQQKNRVVHGNGEIILKVTGGLIGGDRGNFKNSQLEHVFEDNEIKVIEAKIEEILDNRPDSDENISSPVVMSIELEDGQSAEIGVYLQRARNPLVRIRSRSVRGADHSFDSRDFFKRNFKADDILKLSKVGAHKFRVDSINDEQAVEINIENEAEILSELDNKCFIPVKSNWTDSSELFGYYNPLTERYTVTKLLKFILRAKEFPGVPFFVILDEMNLSKVEHYFSDFLSCLESRTVDKHGIMQQEAISLHSGSEFILTNDDEYDEISSSIALPENLYVTGTVNIDDTTFMFSHKVLDRSNVIEFNDVYLDDEQEESEFRLTKIPNFQTFQKANMDNFKELNDESKSTIKNILEVLRKYKLHFGYRTISEISLFIINAKECIDDNETIEVNSLDIQILQKILPKIHGNYAKLQPPLKELIHLLSGEASNISDFDLNQIDAIKIEDTKFPRSLRKMINMYGQLVSQGFTSFIE